MTTWIDVRQFARLKSKYVLLDETHAGLSGRKKVVQVTSPFDLLRWARAAREHVGF